MFGGSEILELIEDVAKKTIKNDKILEKRIDDIHDMIASMVVDGDKFGTIKSSTKGHK